MELIFKESNIFCHQIVEINNKKYLLDASIAKPKTYYWGVSTDSITVEMIELKNINQTLETAISLFKTGTIVVIVQPFIVLLYNQLKSYFNCYDISGQLILKSLLFVLSIFISYLIFRSLLWRAHKIVKTLSLTENRKLRLNFKPIPKRKRNYDAFMLNSIVVICFILYLLVDNGSEGAILVIAGIISLFLWILKFGKVPILYVYKIGNLEFEKIEKIQ